MKDYGFGKMAVFCFLTPFFGAILVGILVEIGSPAYHFWIISLTACFMMFPLFTILWAVKRKETKLMEKQLKAALEGVELTEREERYLEWLSRMDSETVEVFAELFEKIKQAPLNK